MKRIVFPIALALLTVACATPDPGGARAAAGETATAPKIGSDPGRFYDGGAASGREAERNLRTFDELDFEVFSAQDWTRLHESHDHNVTVTWPDGHDTHGIERHISDLKQLFVHAPDTRILLHPIRIGAKDWTAVMGVMEGTFSKPMTLADGTIIQPTGKAFRINMATIAKWHEGRMIQEWLFWDNETYARQLGLMR